MIVLDDMSTDTTADHVKSFASKYHLEDKIKVKSRAEKYGETRNTVEECRHLDPEDVVVRLDAGDYITDIGCLEILNHEYITHDPAVIWTDQRWKFTDINISGPIEIDRSFYEQPWRTSHLKTFRVRDFKGLNPKNFMDEDGEWIIIACDQAIFLPMLERARIRKRPVMYIPRTMYHYDCDAVHDPSIYEGERALKQKDMAEWIRKRGYLP